jgi:hypothetical protein
MQTVFMGAGDEGPASRVESRALSKLSWVAGNWWRAARTIRRDLLVLNSLTPLGKQGFHIFQ